MGYFPQPTGEPQALAVDLLTPESQTGSIVEDIQPNPKSTSLRSNSASTGANSASVGANSASISASIRANIASTFASIRANSASTGANSASIPEAHVTSVGSHGVTSDRISAANLVCEDEARNAVVVDACAVIDFYTVPVFSARSCRLSAVACSAACRSALASCCTAATVALDTCAQIAAMIRPVAAVGPVGR